MKIKLSKNQWEEAGTKAGWLKTAQTIDTNEADLNRKIEEYYFKGWEAKIEYAKGEHMMLNPDMKTNTLGRAFLRGWHDCNLKAKPAQIPSDLIDIVKSDSEITINGDIV